MLCFHPFCSNTNTLSHTQPSGKQFNIWFHTEEVSMSNWVTEATQSSRWLATCRRNGKTPAEMTRRVCTGGFQPSPLQQRRQAGVNFKNCPHLGKEEVSNAEISLQSRLTEHTGKKKSLKRGTKQDSSKKKEKQKQKKPDIESKERINDYM